jgi:hypothetical protein
VIGREDAAAAIRTALALRQRCHAEVPKHGILANPQVLGNGPPRLPLLVEGPDLLMERQPPRLALVRQLLGGASRGGGWHWDGYRAVGLRHLGPPGGGHDGQNACIVFSFTCTVGGGGSADGGSAAPAGRSAEASPTQARGALAQPLASSSHDFRRLDAHGRRQASGQARWDILQLMGCAHAEDRSTRSGEPKAGWHLMHPSWARDRPPWPRALEGWAT